MQKKENSWCYHICRINLVGCRGASNTFLCIQSASTRILPTSLSTSNLHEKCGMYRKQQCGKLQVRLCNNAKLSWNKKILLNLWLVSVNLRNLPLYLSMSNFHHLKMSEIIRIISDVTYEFSRDLQNLVVTYPSPLTSYLTTTFPWSRSWSIFRWLLKQWRW